MDQAWFEHRDVTPWQGRPWVTLRASLATPFARPSAGVLDGEVYIGVATVAVPVGRRQVAERLDWNDLDVGAHRVVAERDGYRPVDTFEDTRCDGSVGVNLVIDQLIELESHTVWHLHPDLVVALRLLRENDTWYRPEEGWAEVVRLSRDEKGTPRSMEIRAEFLSDYLSARGMALYMSSYHQRTADLTVRPAFNWDADTFGETRDRDTREGHIKRQGKVWQAFGALWRTEWVEPSGASLRVRRDRDPNPPTFFTNAEGARQAPAELRNAMNWLYFRPELVLALARHRGAQLSWFSRESGALGATATTLHFGLNRLGLINVFAKDVARLAPWEQRIWSAHNVTPEGGVSRELFAAQMEVQPAQTVAPETRLEEAIDEVDRAVSIRTAAPLLRAHEGVADILRKTNRFRAAEPDGLLVLAKDLTRLFAERIDVKPLHETLRLGKGEKLGSLKSLERLLAEAVGAQFAAERLAPLYGVYDLRLSDAHLGDSRVESGLERVGVDRRAHPVTQGVQMIEGFLRALDALIEGLGDAAAGDSTS